MIIINGNKFAKNDKEFTSSLFMWAGTCVGYYKKTINGIQLLDMQKNIIAFIANGIKRKESPFIVSATRTSKGIRYSYALSSNMEHLQGSNKELSDIVDSLYGTVYSGISLA
jgi:hypothetical protein